MSLGGEVTREHLPRRVGHGAEAARLGDAVGGVRAGLTAAGLGPECGCERAEVVRDSLLRLGSDEGEVRVTGIQQAGVKVVIGTWCLYTYQVLARRPAACPMLPGYHPLVPAACPPSGRSLA